MFQKYRARKGFTLIEMLVVIAIIAVLVAIVVPIVHNSVAKARATTDAANLRNLLGQINTLLVGSNNQLTASTAAELQITASTTFPDAITLVLYDKPGFIDVFYMDNGNYYGLDYFSAIAATGEVDSSISTEAPTGATYQWFEAGVGAYTGE